jgi:hypothetical protein
MMGSSCIEIDVIPSVSTINTETGNKEVGVDCMAIVLALCLHGGCLERRTMVLYFIIILTLSVMEFALDIRRNNPYIYTKPYGTLSLLPTITLIENTASNKPFTTP